MNIPHQIVELILAVAKSYGFKATQYLLDAGNLVVFVRYEENSNFTAEVSVEFSMLDDKLTAAVRRVIRTGVECSMRQTPSQLREEELREATRDLFAVQEIVVQTFDDPIAQSRTIADAHDAERILSFFDSLAAAPYAIQQPAAA